MRRVTGDEETLDTFAAIGRLRISTSTAAAASAAVLQSWGRYNVVIDGDRGFCASEFPMMKWRCSWVSHSFGGGSSRAVVFHFPFRPFLYSFLPIPFVSFSLGFSRPVVSFPFAAASADVLPFSTSAFLLATPSSSSSSISRRRRLAGRADEWADILCVARSSTVAMRPKCLHDARVNSFPIWTS